ncbi:MAG: phosphatidate cytidylyltransferase [Candidatus Omnitrophica bacterium]|nr:phosphatidate cytidylyltransferase [Candidatus Omnitrophota bacterium]
MKFVIRLVIGLSIGALVLWGVWLAPLIVFGMGVCTFSAIALYEFLTMLKLRGVAVNRFFGVVMGFVIPLVVYFQWGITQSGEVLFVVLACFFLFLIQFTRRENPRALEGIALTFFGIMYIGWFLSFVNKMLFIDGAAQWITYLLAVTKSSDIGAYVVGSAFGRHQLIPHISPKKSVEGTAAGLLTSVLVSMCAYGHLPLNFSYFHLAILGGAIGLVGQCGDLAESLIKRYCQTKDSATILPGFGGLLDVIDSILFTAPLFYFYLKIV